MTHVIFCSFSQPQKAIKCVCLPSLQTAHKDYSICPVEKTLSGKKQNKLDFLQKKKKKHQKTLTQIRNFSLCLVFWSSVTGTAHLFQCDSIEAQPLRLIPQTRCMETSSGLIPKVSGRLDTFIFLTCWRQNRPQTVYQFYSTRPFTSNFFFGLHNSAQDLLTTVDQVKIPPHIIAQAEFIPDIVLASDLVWVSRAFLSYKASWGDAVWCTFQMGYQLKQSCR